MEQKTVIAIDGKEYAYSVGLQYELSSDGQGYVCAGIGEFTGSELVIPPVYNNLPVVTIGEFAFFCCQRLTAVVIPSSVRFIHSIAIEDLDNTQTLLLMHTDDEIVNLDMVWDSIAFSDSLTHVSSGIVGMWTDEDKLQYMYNCLGKLDSFSASAKENLAQCLRENIFMLDEIFDQNEPKYIKSLFELGTALGLAEIDKYLENSIQSSSTAITSMLIDYRANKFTKAEIEAYEENKELVEIGFVAPTLKQVNFNWFLEEVDNNYTVVGYKGKRVRETIYSELDGMDKKIISVNRGRKDGYKGIEHLTISEGIEFISSDAFNGSDLKSVTLPSTLKTISGSAFRNTGIEALIIPDGVESIGAYTCFNCNSLKVVVIPNGVKKLGYGVFSSKSNLNIFCMAKEKPKDWDERWLLDGGGSRVYFAGKWHYEDGVPIPD